MDYSNDMFRAMMESGLRERAYSILTKVNKGGTVLGHEYEQEFLSTELRLSSGSPIITKYYVVFPCSYFPQDQQRKAPSPT